jgi:hypothetical protein
MAIGFLMLAGLSVRRENVGSHRMYCHPIFEVFRKSLEKVKVLLKSDKNSGYFV